jgi:hypothetical protein
MLTQIILILSAFGSWHSSVDRLNKGKFCFCWQGKRYFLSKGFHIGPGAHTTLYTVVPRCFARRVQRNVDCLHSRRALGMWLYKADRTKLYMYIYIALKQNSNSHFSKRDDKVFREHAKEPSGSIKMREISWLAAKTGCLLKKDSASWSE